MQAPREVRPEDLQWLRQHFRGGNVLLPSDPGYAQVRFFNQGRFPNTRPAGVIQPTSEEGLRDALVWMARMGIRHGTRGGGHHYEGHSLSSGVVIDTSRLKFNLANQPLEMVAGAPPGTQPSLITVGAGNNLGELYNALATRDGSRNRLMPAGTSESVGVIGHALGGGFADMAPMRGYAAQNIEQVRLVTYNGKILDISDNGIHEVQNGQHVPYQGNISAPDFMRALRGGGQNLGGVVTQMKLRTHDMSGHDMRYFKYERGSLNREQMVGLISAWQQWQTAHPEFAREVSSKFNMTRSGNSYNAEITGVIATTDPARRAAIERSMNEFKIAGGSINVSGPLNTRQVLDKINDTAAFSANANQDAHIVRSSMVHNTIPPAGIRQMVDSMISGGNNPVTIYGMGGATLDRSQASAFAPHGIERTSLPPSRYVVEMETVKPRGSLSTADVQRLEAYQSGFIRASGLDGQHFVYANYPGAANPANNRFATDPALLARIRHEFDPHRVAHAPLIDGMRQDQVAAAPAAGPNRSA